MEDNYSALDKFTALDKDSAFLWCNGATFLVNRKTWKRSDNEGPVQKECMERAVRAFYRLGEFTREEIRNPRVWKRVFDFLMGTLVGACPPDYYFGTDFKEQAGELRQRVFEFYPVYTVKERLYRVLGILLLVVLSVSALVPIPEKVTLINAIFIDALFIVCLIIVGVCFTIGKLAGIISIPICFGLLYVSAEYQTLRTVEGGILLLAAAYILWKLFSCTNFYQNGRLKKAVALERFLELRQEAAALTKGIRQSLDALKEFSSDRCNSEEYWDICSAVTLRTTTTTYISETDIVTDVEEKKKTYSFDDAKALATALIKHYGDPLEALEGAIRYQRKRLQNVGVKVPDL